LLRGDDPPANHSETPNTANPREEDGTENTTIALRDIRVGEELTSNYFEATIQAPRTRFEFEAAKRMGGKITEVEASAITEEASVTRKQLSAHKLAKFLGVTYEQRQALRLTTIGSINVKKRGRKELRKRRDRPAKEAKRRALGMRAQSRSLSATKPWTGLGMSRASWVASEQSQKEA
jgi:SET domain-containing protein